MGQILNWLGFVFCLVVFVTSTFAALTNTPKELEIRESGNFKDVMLVTMYQRQTIMWCVLWGVLTALAFKGL